MSKDIKQFSYKFKVGDLVQWMYSDLRGIVMSFGQDPYTSDCIVYVHWFDLRKTFDENEHNLVFLARGEE